MPIPVSATLSSNFSVVSMGRTYSPKRSGAISSTGRGAGLGVRIGAEQRQPDVLDVLEDDLHLLTEFEPIGIALHDVGGQPDPGVFRDRHLRDHVRRRQPGQAEPMVHGESGERRLAGDGPHAHIAGAAVPAHRRRRMDQRCAGLAFLQPQRAVGSRSPEELVLVP